MLPFPPPSQDIPSRVTGNHKQKTGTPFGGGKSLLGENRYELSPWHGGDWTTEGCPNPELDTSRARYTSSRPLLSVLDRVVHFALQGSDVQQNLDARIPEITRTAQFVAQ